MAIKFPLIWLDKSKIQENLDSKIIGKHILVYDAVSSTNSVLRKMAKEGESQGTVVVAQIQETGHGRLNRTWFSPKGGLWLSIVLRPKIAPSEAAKITLMAAVAIAKTLRKTGNLNARIKWPNDVLVGGKKICGILTEMRTRETEIEYMILGIGINANFELSEFPEEIKEHATTVIHEIKSTIDLENLLTDLLLNLDFFYQQLISGSSKDILNEWKELSDTLGRNVIIKTQKESLEGKALDLAEDGALVIKTASGVVKKIYSGDCIHLRTVEGEL